jgi:hypothetical protein
MPKDNVPPITPNSLTLEGVNARLNGWRASKKRANEGIPIALWQQIFELLGQHTETKIRSVLRLTPTQLERGSALIDEAERLNRECNAPNADEVSIDFCEAQEEFSYPLASKPAEAFATNTSIVELYRPDGMLMKIHICTDRFEELLRAFFKG